MTKIELEAKLNKLSLEQFGKVIKANYKKLLEDPKKLGWILKIYGAKVLENEKVKKVTKDSAIEELLNFDLFGKGGDKK